MSIAGGSYPFTKDFVVSPCGEDHCAIVPSLDYVQRLPGNDEAWLTSHSI